MKNFKYQFVFLLILLGLSACFSDNGGHAVPEPPIDSVTIAPKPLEILQIKGQPISLVVITEQAIIRAEPSLEAAEIGRRVKGDSILFTNKISGFNTAIKLEGVPFNEPWLRVILEGNQMGWVYGACINFKASEHPALKKKVLDQRAVALFGRSLARQIALYQKETQSAATLPAFRTLYTRAQTLKDSLEERMNILLRMSDGAELLDFFWLNELMSGLLVHYIPEHKKYYLFKDFKYWQSISLKTEAAEDDAFVELLLTAYASDSIEYYFYDWQLLVDSQTTCSLLGANIHSKVLDQIGETLDSNGYFKNEILELKQAIVDDISISDHYWLPLESIQSELAAIIKRNYKFLASNDWVEIKTRRQMLDNYQKNNIKIDLFAGR